MLKIPDTDNQNESYPFPSSEIVEELPPNQRGRFQDVDVMLEGCSSFLKFRSQEKSRSKEVGDHDIYKAWYKVNQLSSSAHFSANIWLYVLCCRSSFPHMRATVGNLQWGRCIQAVSVNHSTYVHVSLFQVMAETVGCKNLQTDADWKSTFASRTVGKWCVWLWKWS